MKDLKILGITAVVSVGLASILCWGLLADIQAGYRPLASSGTSITVDSGSWTSINASLKPNDRWAVDYQATGNTLMQAYLMTNAQYNDYLYLGGYYGSLDSRSGDSGQFDYTASASDTYFVVFLNNDAHGARIYLDIEKDIMDYPIVDF